MSLVFLLRVSLEAVFTAAHMLALRAGLTWPGLRAASEIVVEADRLVLVCGWLHAD